MSENRKFKDSEVLNNYISYMSENNPTYYDENAYYFGAHFEYNGLDVQNLKHPFFESNQTNNTSSKKNKA
jgi:hypothetical protein